MWIVRIALRRPYTFVVLALLILMVGPLTIARTPTDIFPNIDIPVVTVVWNYGGLSADEMSNRIVSIYERNLTDDGQRHRARRVAVAARHRGGQGVLPARREDRSGGGAGDRVGAVAAAAAAARHPAAVHPHLQRVDRAGAAARALRQEALGAAAVRHRGELPPHPAGQRQRARRSRIRTAASSRRSRSTCIPEAMQAKHLTPADVVNAISVQNLILPGGTQKLGTTEYDVDMNASPKTIEELNDLPIRTVGGNTIYIHDVAHVRDGFPPQTNIVRVDGSRAALLTIQKVGNASTLDIINNVKDAAAEDRGEPAAGAGDQAARRSVGVRAGVDLRRAARGADRRLPDGADDPGLPRQLAQHGDHRGLDPALDPELDHRAERARRDDQHHDARRAGARRRHAGRRRDGGDREHQLASGAGQGSGAGDSRRRRIRSRFRRSSRRICICIVFVPMFFLTGVARYLFVPMAEAVVFAMLASYVLSRTLVPTMAKYLLHAHEPHGEGRPTPQPAGAASSARSTAASCGCATAIARCSSSASAAAGSSPRCSWPPASRRCSWRAGSARTSSRRSTAASSSCTCARRAARASRRRRSSPTTSRTRCARSSRPASWPASSTTSGFPTPGLNLSYSTSAPIGPGDADIMVSLGQGPSADRRVHPRSADVAAEAVSRRHLLVRAGRHRHADSELRPAGADRHPDRRPQHRRRTARSPAGW